MTTNRTGAVTQQPLYGCINCYEDCTWTASDLRVYGGECWCYVCWEEIRGWEFPDKPFWNDLEPYTPALQAPQPAEVGADEREAFETARDAAYRTEPGTFDAWDAWQARAQLTEGADWIDCALPDHLPPPEHDKPVDSESYYLGIEVAREAMRAALTAAGGREEWANQAVEAMQRVRFAMAMNHWDWKSEASNDMKREAYRLIDEAIAASQPAKEVRHD